MKRASALAFLLLMAPLAANAQTSPQIFAAIPHPISLSQLRQIGEATDIKQVERLLGATAPADRFSGREGPCSEYKFRYGVKGTSDHVTVQACDNGYFGVQGISHDSYSLTANNEGLFDCHLLFGKSGTPEDGYDACPR